MNAGDTEGRERREQKLLRELGPELVGLMNEPEVREVMVNPDGAVFVERATDGLQPTELRACPLQLKAALLDTVITKDSPVVQGELQLFAGRIEGLRAPVVEGPSFSFRKQASQVFALANYEESGRISPEQHRLLREAIGDKKNILVVGGTGSGKTTLINALLRELEAQSPDDRIILIEDTRELQCSLPNQVALRAVQGASHVDFGLQAPELCPLQDLRSEQERAWAADWIEQLLALQGMKIDSGKRPELIEALHTFCMASGGGSLTDFVTTLQDASMRTALSYYASKGPGAAILDGDRTELPKSHFTVFEIEDLMNMGPKVVDATLLYLFHYIEQQLDGRPTLLLLDEAWLALGNALFSDKIRQWLKVLRKNNCAVVLATQSLSDVVHSPIRDAVLESCPTRLLLPNPEADSAVMGQLYRDYLRLDDAQVALIAGAERKRHYYYASPTGTRLFELKLGPVALSFFGAGSKPELAAICSHKAASPRTWPARWLEERGLSEAAERWVNLANLAALTDPADPHHGEQGQ